MDCETHRGAGAGAFYPTNRETVLHGVSSAGNGHARSPSSGGRIRSAVGDPGAHTMLDCVACCRARPTLPGWRCSCATLPASGCSCRATHSLDEAEGKQLFIKINEVKDSKEWALFIKHFLSSICDSYCYCLVKTHIFQQGKIKYLWVSMVPINHVHTQQY